jgi:uncharacterized protein (TIGR02145 family)
MPSIRTGIGIQKSLRKSWTQQIGTIIEDSFDRSSLGSNWVQNTPNSTIVLDGSKMIWSHEAGTIHYDNYIGWKNITALERWEEEIVFKPSEKSANSFGIAIHTHSLDPINSFNLSVQLHTANTTGLEGKLYITNNNNTGIIYTCTDAITITSGHSYKLRVKRTKTTFEIYAQNLNDLSETSGTYIYPSSYPSTANVFIPNQGYLGFMSFCGASEMNYEVTYCKISSEAFKHPYTTLIGDSIGVGYGPSEITERYFDKIFGTRNTRYNNMSSNGDKISTLNSRITEILLYKPTYAFVSVGANDSATNHTTWQASYETFLDTLLNAGIKVVVGKPVPYNASDLSWMNTILDTICAARSIKIVDLFTALKGGGTGLSASYDIGDGCHPNSAGYSLIASTVLSAAPELLQGTLEIYSIVVDETTPTHIDITFNVPISGGAKEQFALGGGKTVSSISITGSVLTIISNAAYTYGDSAIISYAKGTLVATTGGKYVESFSDTITYDWPTDASGNVYTSVLIGTQRWLKESLKTTKFNDGSAIPNVTDDLTWAGLSDGAMCWYGNDIATKFRGALYNGYVLDDAKGIAPVGYHIPTDAELTTLVTYLGGDAVAGNKIKEAGTTNWDAGNSGDNSSGFTANGQGQRIITTGQSLFAKQYSPYWTKTNGTAGKKWRRYLVYNTGEFTRVQSEVNYGFSVRCIKN